MASVVRLAFTFPAPGILGYESGDYEAHHSKSSSGSFSLSPSLSLLLPLSSPIGFTPLLFLVVVVLLHTQTFSVPL